MRIATLIFLLLLQTAGAAIVGNRITRAATDAELIAALTALGYYTNGVPPSPTNNPPIASFTYSTNNYTVTFTNLSVDSDGTIVSNLWTFGDGGTTNIVNPVHSYTNGGGYVVGLTVTDNNGLTNIYAAQVTLQSTNTSGTNYNILALSAEYRDVTNAVAQATAGQTVKIPPGTANWSNSVTLRNVSLIGSGTNFTHIFDTVPTNTVYYPSVSGPLPLVTISGGNSGFNNVTRLTDIDFEFGGIKYNGFQAARIIVSDTNTATLTVLPTNAPVVIQRCIFNSMQFGNIKVYDGCSALIRDCVFTLRATGIDVFGWGANGEVSYALPANYGTTNLVVVENCWFTNALGHQQTSAAVMDVYNGARIIFRNNTVLDDFWSNHGLDSGGPARSGRQQEIYGNTFTSVGGSSAFAYPINFRGGSGVIYSNTVTGYASPSAGGSTARILQADYYRSAYNNTPYRGANGFGIGDSNGTVELTFTVTNASVLNKIVAANPTNWTVNQWVGYTVYCTNNGLYSCISSNTTQYAWVQAAKDTYNSGNMQDLLTTNGQTFTFRRVLPVDMEGLGSGDYVQSINSLYVTNVTVGGTNGWIHQVSEPVYVWANLIDGVTNNYVAAFPVIRLGTDIITNSTAKPGYTPLVYPHPLSQ